MFEPTLPSIAREMQEMAGHEGPPLDVRLRFVPRALEALNAGDEEGCINHIADFVETAVQQAQEKGEHPSCVAFAMFSMARGRHATEERLRAAGCSIPVLTSPDTAVLRMKALLSK
ncbi:unnamed protein product [Polarella glacialis]|uniref:Uncharacterized protein n=1 Tax=Polarella glacialis TaxID=89957 RepID=A0A813GF91_POLGL|nr:unnamed protein product [Polarella glacialis]